MLGSDETKYQYREVRNICASTLLKSGMFYEGKIVKESMECFERFYLYINQEIKGRGITPELRGDCSTASLVVDDYGNAIIFSNYFSNIYIYISRRDTIPFFTYEPTPERTHWTL